MITEAISFLLNGDPVTIKGGVNGALTSATLLNEIRETNRLTATKEGCAEGDCGACTVIIAELDARGKMHFKAVNSCIIFSASLANKAVLTLEFFSNGDILHPLQQKFVDHNASQCGFCTPGFIMSAMAARLNNISLKTSADISAVIAGNLCRCTGYGPIIKAIEAAQSESEPRWMLERLEKLQNRLTDLSVPSKNTKCDEGLTTYRPKTVADLLNIYHENPDALLIAGATDVGLWATKKLQSWPKAIFLRNVDELCEIKEDENSITIGAGVTHEQVMPSLISCHPHLEPYLIRFASKQIRNSGTVAGNIANGSPIGDMPPLLIAMGARIILQSRAGMRDILLQDFFIDYGKQNIYPGEVLTHVIIPKCQDGHLRAYKISKRFEQDISAVSLGINIYYNTQNIIEGAYICFGGMAAIPKRATKAEEYLKGKKFSQDILQSAGEILCDDFTPLTDMRASSDYRMAVAKNLLVRYYLDVSKGHQGIYEADFGITSLTDPKDNNDAKGHDTGGANNNMVGSPISHDSAALHVSGKAHYTDDLPTPANLLHMAFVTSPVAHGMLKKITCDDDILLIKSSDIIGRNGVNPIRDDDPLFSDGRLEYFGQPIAAVLADSHLAARKIAKNIKVECEELPPLLDLEEALKQQSYVAPPVEINKGDALSAMQKSPHSLTGMFDIGGQDHFYLEGQIALAIPHDDGQMTIYSSTQHPSEIQHIVAAVLNMDYHKIRVIVRRMGGAFGGKESQANLTAAAAAVAAYKTGRAIKLRLDRDDDMIITGKRHAFRIKYQVGFDDKGMINALNLQHLVQCGFSCDLSIPVADRAIAHADSAYYIPHLHLESYRLKTNTVSNTAFRGFGGPQGMIGMERIIDHISHYLSEDATIIRLRNLYDEAGKLKGRCTTPYNMRVEDNILPGMMQDIMKKSDYHARRDMIKKYNEKSTYIKRGIALSPVKFGISFNLAFLNQAGALVHIYQDGSVKINHGGTEMGQGLMTKCAMVAAESLQIPLDKIQISATDTDKVPNTSATAASSGADLNGMAIKNACDILKARLNDFIASDNNIKGDIIWDKGAVHFNDQRLDFIDLVKKAYVNRVSLSATGYYKTPKIHWDAKNFKGRPFYYFAYGVAVSEIAVDILTGEVRQLRCDILHDVGHSLNPAVDLGQIEGGYVQGMGWLTGEELVWNDAGKLVTHAPSTYKIPTSYDRPLAFNISLYDSGGNKEDTIYKSKAVGEPPLMLAISNYLAISDAISSVSHYKKYSNLQAPATPEAILSAIQQQK